MPGPSGAANRANQAPDLDLNRDLEQEERIDSDMEDDHLDRLTREANEARLHRQRIAKLLASPSSSTNDRSQSRSPGRSPSPPRSPRTRERRVNGIMGGASPAPPVDDEPGTNANFSEQGGEISAAGDLETPVASGRATVRARKRAKKNPPSQGELYEKYMAAKIRAEEARAENYQTAADANRAAMKASEDQSRAARDTSRAMLAMESFYKNEQRHLSSSDTSVTTLPVTPIVPYHHPPQFFPFDTDNNFGANDGLDDGAAADGGGVSEEEAGDAGDENQMFQDQSQPSPTYG